MEIRQLQTFRTVVEMGSFTQAALQLKYAQSTITAHIQMLEEELGGPLFDRLGRKMLLTEVGKELYPHAVEILEAFAKIKSIPIHRQEIKGELRIGASETLTVYRLGPLLAAYKKSFPNVKLSLINDTCSRMREMLHSGELDLAFVLEPIVKDPDLTVEVIRHEPIVFIGGVDCGIEKISMAHRERISRECIIFTEEYCSLRLFFEAYLKEREILPNNTLTFSSMEAIKQCVASGLGISLIPLVSTQSLLQENRVKRIACDDETLNFYAQLAYHKNKWISPAQEKFIEIASAYFVGGEEKNE